MKPETFLFTEQFFYRVGREPRSDSAATWTGSCGV
jgi:hypothetical protein